MLFHEFFPRLQDRAASRYGQTLTERQFKDWRERGLLSGPAPPVGKGRGRSPERRWPTSSYRRALRICRYKGRGYSQAHIWWVLLWISGEQVSSGRIRKSLVRELKHLKRQSRNLADSGYLNSRRREHAGTAPKNPQGDALSEAVSSAMDHPRFGINLDLQRNVLRQRFNEAEPAEVRRVFMSSISRLMGHDVTPEEVGVPLNLAWRPGSQSETNQDFIGTCSNDDLDLARRILWQETYLARRLVPTAHLIGVDRLSSILFVFSAVVNSTRLNKRWALSELIQKLYEIASDHRAGENPERRLTLVQDSHRLIDAEPEFFNDLVAMKEVWASVRGGSTA